MKVPRVLVSLLLGLSASALALHAHHSVGSNFNTSQLVTVTGVVTSLQWRNPHVTFHVAVKNGDGSISDWRMEMKAPSGLSALGLDQADVPVGMQVRARVFPAKNGTKSGNMRNLQLEDGRNFDVGDTFPQR
jgi:Family of unknown function (DUF6152)